MTRNLKALGLALLAVFALGAIGTQAASAADAHEFHSDGPRTIITANNVGEGSHTFQVGAAGTVECTGATFESTVVGTEVVKDQTYKADTITATPKYTGCTFGGQPATVFFNDCAYVLDSDTTEGNTTVAGSKHANVDIECAANNKIQVHTVNCTITVGAQTVKHAVTYKNVTESSVTISTTAHGVVVGKERNTAAQPANGCLLFPTGAVGKYVGNVTSNCFKDENETTPANPTTPTGTLDKTTTKCTVTDV